ncbi:HAD family hydrolase [Breznakiella homolactica]|uniref:HAD family hydrolase n=1 Tax=Breznakiella homolactica TaxID=2798577 RepID=A0A7T8BBV8_9SPIR|nr:HAD family hydrolase [Breznakiella homolactica]QQO10791.1 HAD family hydrolase [Breznakiella homolactica]
MNEAERQRYVSIIRDSSEPLETLPQPPLPAEFEARLIPGKEQSLRGISTVLFDVYGTLFSSSAGDIGVSSGYVRGSLDDLALRYTEDCTGEELKAYFRNAVLQAHERLFSETPYPEVRVDELWKAFPRKADTIGYRELALRYELAVNPVYPMAGARDCLRDLSAAGITLGIISNAQFYTPLLFEAFFGSLPEAMGFDPDLLVYSYREGEAKPAPSLFNKALDVLRSRGQDPGSVLYIGNDMLNDIYGAASAGFKTVLFAGDPRSLRLREGNRLIRNTMPDGVVRRLEDLLFLADRPRQ